MKIQELITQLEELKATTADNYEVAVVIYSYSEIEFQQEQGDISPDITLTTAEIEDVMASMASQVEDSESVHEAFRDILIYAVDEVVADREKAA